jgi:antagonist of KipI
MSLRVVEPGLCTLVVDHGRPHSRSLGVPVGGAADRSALAVGNALVGNLADAAALEITLVGPALHATQRVGAVVAGAPFHVSVGRHTLSANRTFTLEAGDELHVGGTRHGARAYLCVVGGFQGALVLGSRSSLAPLRRGDEVVCTPSACPARLLREEFAADLVPALSPELRTGRSRLRVIPGPQADWFSGTTDDNCFTLDPATAYTVTPASNRMGLRLSGPPLPVPPRELVSEAVAPGSIQVTRDGQMIVLGMDGQTVGGYPKVATVISADLDALGQLRPGDTVAFETVALEEAQRLARDRQRRLEQLCARLRLAASL